MATNNIYKELKAAVDENDLGKVKTLLAAGVDPNFVPTENIAQHQLGNSLLHYANSAEIVKELISWGASVNFLNSYKETPLHTFIARGQVKLVKELLRYGYGADVNSRDRRGNTPLKRALRYYNAEIIKELLERDAELNVRNGPEFWNYNTTTIFDTIRPSDDAAALLMMKVTLLKNFEKWYSGIIGLNPNKERSNYSKLISYLDDCLREILRIKSDQMKVYELITNNFSGRNELCNYLSAKLKFDNFGRYPLYKDIILEKIEERADLLSKLNNIQVYTMLDNGNENVKRGKIILDYDSTYIISECLSNKDLANFIDAFEYSNKCVTIQLNNLIETNTGLSEIGTGQDAKRAKFE